MDRERELERLLFKIICQNEVLQSEYIKLTGGRYVFEEWIGNECVDCDIEGYPSIKKPGGNVREEYKARNS